MVSEIVFITKIIDFRTIGALAKQGNVVRFSEDRLRNRGNPYNECFLCNRYVLTNIHIIRETVNREKIRNAK